MTQSLVSDLARQARPRHRRLDRHRRRRRGSLRGGRLPCRRAFQREPPTAAAVGRDDDQRRRAARRISSTVTSARARRAPRGRRVGDKLGGLDVLVNNAGGLVKRVPVAEIDDAIFDEIVDLNVRSLVACCAAAVPHMRKAGRGNIINVTSIAARHGGGPGAALYASSKAFVSTFTRGLARELAGDRFA